MQRDPIELMRSNRYINIFSRMAVADRVRCIYNQKAHYAHYACIAECMRSVASRKGPPRLKRVKKVDGEVPEEVQRECSLLTHGFEKCSLPVCMLRILSFHRQSEPRKDIDHPFIMTQVNTFETKTSARGLRWTRNLQWSQTQLE